MDQILWNETFSINVAEIDEQHMKLIDMINNLSKIKKQGPDAAAIAVILSSMADYLDYHFSTEEKYMLQFSFPEYNGHKAEHAEFIKKTIRFVKGFGEGRQALSDEILAFLKTWLSNHILTTDTKLGPFFNENGLR